MALTTFPNEGKGSVATFGRRLIAFIIDGILADIISILVLHGYAPGTKQNLIVYGAFLVIELLFVWLAGQTPGMRAAGIIVVRYDDGRRQSVGWIFVRTLLIATIVPALIPGSDGRWMHDRAAGTAMLRTGG